MRIVLDTNILVRAVASPGGPAGELFERIADEHTLVLSVESLAELARVLQYEHVRRLHQLSDRAIADFLQSTESGALMVVLPDPVPRVVPDDADDDPVVATAVAGHADVLCTRNRHLQHEDVVAYCSERGISVMDDVALLQRLRAAHSGADAGNDSED